jgi:hypothetical protein
MGTDKTAEKDIKKTWFGLTTWVGLDEAAKLAKAKKVIEKNGLTGWTAEKLCEWAKANIHASGGKGKGGKGKGKGKGGNLLKADTYAKLTPDELRAVAKITGDLAEAKEKDAKDAANWYAEAKKAAADKGITVEALTAELAKEAAKAAKK